MSDRERCGGCGTTYAPEELTLSTDDDGDLKLLCVFCQ